MIVYSTLSAEIIKRATYTFMNNKERRYRVTYGYNKGDFFSISEDELAKAIYAKLHGYLFIYDKGTCAKDGKTFLSFDPDYHYANDWNDDHSPVTNADKVEKNKYLKQCEGKVVLAYKLASLVQGNEDAHLLATPLEQEEVDNLLEQRNLLPVRNI